MIEFSDFYENYQASTETLQCPRCSASVPANPGVCGNCGENVYQCHKCRWDSGLLCRYKKRKKCLFLINIFVKVHQLWWKRPLPVQCLWFLQVCTVWLHVACKTLLCCGSHWKWRRQEKGEQDWLYGLELDMLNKVEHAWQNNRSQYDQTLNIFVERYNFVSSYPMVSVDILKSYVNCFFLFTGCNKHQYSVGQSWSGLPPTNGPPATAGESTC